MYIESWNRRRPQTLRLTSIHRYQNHMNYTTVRSDLSRYETDRFKCCLKRMTSFLYFFVGKPINKHLLPHVILVCYDCVYVLIMMSPRSGRLVIHSLFPTVELLVGLVANALASGVRGQCSLPGGDSILTSLSFLSQMRVSMCTWSKEVCRIPSAEHVCPYYIDCPSPIRLSVITGGFRDNST